MAEELSQDAVLLFLQSRGGSVTNAELLLYFRAFLREHVDRERNRELFKKFVNSVARVKQADGVSHVVLQRRYRGKSRGESPDVSTKSNVHLSPLWNADKARNNGPVVLPAAGIILSNINSIGPNLNLPKSCVSGAPPPAPETSPALPGDLSSEEVKVAPFTFQEPKLPCDFTPHNLSHPPPSNVILSQVHCGMLQQRQPSASAIPVSPVQLRALRATARHRQSYRSALSLGDEDERENKEEEAAVVLLPERRASSPEESMAMWDVSCGGKSQSLMALERNMASVLLQEPRTSAGSEETAPPFQTRKLSPEKAFHPQVSEERTVHIQVTQHRTVPQIHIQDVDTGYRQRMDQQPRFRTGFPLPVHNLYDSSSSGEGGPKVDHVSSGWSSCDDVTHPRGPVGSGGPRGPGNEAGGHPDGWKWQWSAAKEGPVETRGRAWHRSTGDLCDNRGDHRAYSSPSPPPLLCLAVGHRQTTNLKRMCLSVGANLDQLMNEDDKRALGGSEAARLHRLHLISSSLSLRHVSSISSLSSCSTPSQCHSLADLTDRDATKEQSSTQSTSHYQEPTSRQSHVPLEEREHLWLVKAATGMWTEIYSLFRDDPSLLHKRDFMSGFTVLHWIAKHGDHRVLNTLWYGVEKTGMMFDTDAQASCGYTPLHIAAIHNHKNIIRLLVNKFKADVSLRDAAGRKAWFYLPLGAPPDLFQLLGAPAKAALGSTPLGKMWGDPQTNPQTKKHRRRHRFSSTSGQRPHTYLGNAKVKRSSSLAAFLKSKPLQKVKAEWAI